MTKILNATNVPNIPWEDKPSDCKAPVWRNSNNPIIGRNPVEGIARVFNGAAVPFEGKFIAVFRCEKIDTKPELRVARSDDGLSWNIESKAIEFIGEDGKPYPLGGSAYAYDPRVVKVEDWYYAIWCMDFNGASIGMAKTQDFKTFIRLENPFIPFNRNAVLFPRKVNDQYLLLSRPSDSGHTPFGDIFLSRSNDLTYWGKHRHVMSSGGQGWWQATKIGGGPAPIETDEGWLMFYHGVTQTCNGYVYSMGVVVLDLENPSIVKYRSKNYILTPEEWYEERGFVPNVVFPCAALHDQETGRISIYYGAADSYIAMAHTTVDEIVRYAKETHETIGNEQEEGKF